MNKKKIICCLMLTMLLLSGILQIFPLSNIVKADDQELTISNPIPANDSVDQAINPTLSVDVADGNGDNMDISFYANVSIDYSPSTPVLINNTYCFISNRVPSERKIWYANNRYWVFYGINHTGTPYTAYSSSIDGETWTAPITITEGHWYSGADFSTSIWGNTIRCIWAYSEKWGGRYPEYWIGNLNSNGTITWITEGQIIPNDDSLCDPAIAINNSGYTFLGFYNDSYYAEVMVSSSNGDTFVMKSGYPQRIFATRYYNSILVPMENGSIYDVLIRSWASGSAHIYGRLYNGIGWETAQDTGVSMTSHYYAQASAVAVGNDIHVVYAYSTLIPAKTYIRHIVRNSTTGTWSTYKTIDSDVADTSTPVLSRTSNNGLVCAWSTDNNIYYSTYYNGIWSSHEIWVNADVYNDNRISIAYEEQNDRVGLTYLVENSSKYSLYYTYLEDVGDRNWILLQENLSVGNGTYTCKPSCFNELNTTYNWKVSANDGINTVTEQYNFYTGSGSGTTNNPPSASNPIPANSSINIAKPPSSFSITINDPDNDKMNITWQTNQSGTWTTFNTSTNKTGGTYVVTNTTWVNQYNHKYYWRVTVNDGHDGSVTNWYSFTTKANSPPEFTDQNPANLSTGIALSLATWNVTIEDPNGETFNWTIQTSPNVGSSSANGATNGSKSTNLAGLTYSTQYKVYVNATDGISWTRRWYGFTTINAPGNNTPPSVTSPYPANDSAGITIPLPYFRLVISDPDGDKMNITWQTNATGVWTTFNTTASQDNGTYYAYNTIWVNTYGKKYYWRTFVNDGHGGWNNQSYLMFTVRTETSPSVSSPIPTNGSTGVSKTLSSLSITISDAESDTMDITWQTNASGAWSTIDTSADKSDGTYTTTATYWVNQYSHKYYWKALVKDEVNGWTNRTYYFTTLANVAPTANSVYPTNHSTNIAKPPAYLRTKISDAYGDKMNITWRSNSTGIWKTLNTTTGVYNGIYYSYNTSFANAFNTKYYWQTCIRDWYGMWKNTTYDFTTAQHTPPSITTYYPTTGTTLSGKSLSYISVSVNSSYGYAMNITWKALIGGIWKTLGTNESVSNGTYITRNTTFVSAYSTAYNWNVSIDDGHAVWTNESYSFTTGAAPGGGNGGGGGGGGYYVPLPTDNTATGTPSDTKKGLPGFEFIILFFALILIILIRKYKRK